MLLPLVLLFIVVPIAELAVIIQVGQGIVRLWAVPSRVAASSLGSVLMRSQGRAAWRRFNDTSGAGRVPAREVLDGALIVFGGALLLTPGFLTDILGLILLIPPTRALIRRILARRLADRMVVSVTGPRVRRRQDDDVEGTAIDVEGTAIDVDTTHDPSRRL